MTATASIRVGDRVLARERPWRVERCQPLPAGASVVELRALDGDVPSSLSIVVPPDEVTALPSETLKFDTAALDPLGPWLRAHRLIAATSLRDAMTPTGACFGRVALEAYQLAPTLRLLSKPRPRLLIADDVGLGKTIEAGLAMLELLARGRVKRILVVAPPGLLLQWQEELSEKFGLEFALIENVAGLAREQSDLPAGTSPWDVLPRVLTSIDFLKKETVHKRALRKAWDLVVVDEAHALAESGTPQNPYRTQRTRLGIALAEGARGLILLTATPHNGYAHSFRSLIELVEPTCAAFTGTAAEIGRRVEMARIRRMKAQIKRRLPDGSEQEVFPRRNVEGIPVKASDKESELLRKVGSYCSRTARSAEGAEDEDLVSFAMQIVKKRALSSRRALERTLEHRLEALKKGEDDAQPAKSEIRDLQAELPLNEAAAERTAERIVRSAIPKEQKRRKAEVAALNGIRRLLKGLTGPDPKIQVLVAELQRLAAMRPPERVIVFTEYRDTLDVILEAIETAPALPGRAVVLRGGMSPRQRLVVQAKFESEEIRILLATDAASEGLNLQRACRRVIHFELPWNPNRMEQRNGRVDRYGQTRPPEIRYLFYPDSPEETVLQHLVSKIEKMQDSHLSTPDILGVLQGYLAEGHGLVRLDPEDKGVEAAVHTLVKHFEDRTAEFVRRVQPLVAAGGPDRKESDRILDALNRAESLLPDDTALEAIVREALGQQAVAATGDEGVFRINVPHRFRGLRVEPCYPRATFRRSIAARSKSSDVEFITPIHPLILSLAAEARARFLQVYEGERGLTPRRLAARRITRRDEVSAVFTFLGAVQGEGGPIEEPLIAVRVSPAAKVVGTPELARGLLDGSEAKGSVSPELLRRHFASAFDKMAVQAAAAAMEHLRRRVGALRGSREEQVDALLRDLEADTAARLKEIDEEERRALGLVEAETGQQRLFGIEARSSTPFETRRALAKHQADQRREELNEHAIIREPANPRPMGVLFLVPEGL